MPAVQAVTLTAPFQPLTPRAHAPQGAPSAELQAAQQAGPAARGATAYLNLEPGDCHGDDTALRALLDAGVARAVVGLPQPLRHLRGASIAALRAAGMRVDVLGQTPCLADEASQRAALNACLAVNEVRLPDRDQVLTWAPQWPS